MRNQGKVRHEKAHFIHLVMVARGILVGQCVIRHLLSIHLYVKMDSHIADMLFFMPATPQ